MRAVELFAGIGGLALGAPEGCAVVAAFDQDAAARATHALNHGVPTFAFDLAHVDERELARHEADAWLMSPPCQPFTRRGRGRDVDDPRCHGLLRVVELLPRLRPRRVLCENVLGFAGSRAHAALVAALGALGHDVATVEACPSDLGWPVRRPRQFVLSSADGLAPAPPRSGSDVARRLEDLLDRVPHAELRIPPELLARGGRFAGADARGALATFTRSYGAALTGAGPVHDDGSGARWYSPDEILRLHGFPGTFRFPDGLDLRTRWRLAGNAVHVASVSAVAQRLRTPIDSVDPVDPGR